MEQRIHLSQLFKFSGPPLIFEPLDFIPQGTLSIASRSHLVARLAAQVPRPRVNLARFHGIFAPNSRWRAQVTPAGRGKRVSPAKNATEPEKHRAMTWARRLKRVFKIDIETCEHCGGAVRIIACIEDPVVIRKILEHLKRRESSRRTAHAPRAPPQASQPRQMN